MNQKIFHAATLALAIAKKYEGATSPNPPVGAVGLTKEGDILGLAAHEREGAAHAEANLIQKLSHQGTLEALHTLIVTLEPCNHYGKTPPCVKTILETNVKVVIVGCLDPNPLVNGKGFRTLKEKVSTYYLSEYTQSLSKECENLRCAPWAGQILIRNKRFGLRLLEDRIFQKFPSSQDGFIKFFFFAFNVLCK